MTYLLQSVRQLLPRFPRLRCLLIGEGSLHNQLAREIAEWNLQDHVQLMGFQAREQVLGLVRAADVFVMPSLSEGTPVAILEAAALAKPIVASRVGGIPAILADQVDALLVPPADVAALSDALARLLGDPALAARLGERARHRALSDFGPATQVVATCQAYERAIERAAARQGKLLFQHNGEAVRVSSAKTGCSDPALRPSQRGDGVE